MQNPSELAYEDFEVEIGLGNGREYPIAVIRSTAGEAHETMHFPFDELALENRLLTLQNALLRSGGKRRLALSQEEQTVQDFGKELWNALLTGEVRNRYDVSLERANREGKGLRLKLRIQEPKLAALPWEFMYEPRQAEYICLSRNTSVVRYLELPQSVQPLTVEPPLRILGMASNPADLHNDKELDIAREKQRVEKAIKSLQANGLVELTWLEGQTWRDLQKAMRTGVWHIFYFIGHGGFDLNTDEGLIALADEEGKTHLFGATQLGMLLADHRSLRLVILNSCEGARGSEHDIFSSTASILVRRGVPSVLAMQYEITDRAAIEFSRAFYEAIADGLPVDAAVAEARKAVRIAVANTVEWGTPVLYMRSPDGVLFGIQKKKAKGRKRVKEPVAREKEKPLEEKEEKRDIELKKKEAEQREQERREQEERRAELSALYSKGTEALGAQDWQTAINHFNDILTLDAGYRDASARLKEAEKKLELAQEKERQQLEEQKKAKALQEELKGLYDKGKRAVNSEDWETAISAFREAVALDSQYQDAAKLLAFAESELKKIEERKKQEIRLAELYARAVKANKANNWTLVISTCQEIRTINPSYKDVATLLDAAKTNLLQQEKEQPRVKREEKGPSYNKLLVAASVLGILLLGYWMIAPGLNESSKTPDKTQTTPTAVATTASPAAIMTSTTDKKTITNSIGMEFVLTPAGEFDMGSPSNETNRNDDENLYHVKFANPFYMSKYEVTQKQWRIVMESNPSYFKGDNLPVESVSWDDVQHFIRELNKKEGTNKYRLPSESEWEYAARAGTTTRYFFGNEESKLRDYAWYNVNSEGKTHIVGQLKPNQWGLYDIYGNNWEWVQDIYYNSYSGAPQDGSAREGDGIIRIVRGGGWNYSSGSIRSARRAPVPSSYHFPDYGFRLVKDL